jgi:hypothetical protein
MIPKIIFLIKKLLEMEVALEILMEMERLNQ